MIKEELYDMLKIVFGLEWIFFEYGMSELLLQVYFDKDGLFEFFVWMKVCLCDVNDLFFVVKGDCIGGVDVIDFVNFYFCVFIVIQDFGRLENGKLCLMGWFDYLDICGCNLLVQ